MSIDVDVPLLRKTLEKITANRETWLQGVWAILQGDSELRRRIDAVDPRDRDLEVRATAEEAGCGTAFCLAGHVVADSGATLVWGSSHDADTCISPFTGREDSIAHVAERMLGLTSGQAETLFAGTNSLPMLWAVAEIITGGEIELPPAEVVGNPGYAEKGAYTGTYSTAAKLRNDAMWRLRCAGVS